jgi:uncharacterized protein
MAESAVANRQAEAIRKLLQVNSVLVERLGVMSRLGMSFDGKRDIYQAAGYKKRLVFEDFYGAYRRQDIARRVVRAPVDETWRKPPQVLDGLTPDEARDDTPFVQAWNRLAYGTEIGEKPETNKGLLHYLNRIDRISGIGRYGVLYLGVRDGKSPDQPLEKGAAKGPDSLLFAATYDEGSAQIASQIADRQNERYTLPEYYNLSVATSGDGGTSSLRVHWTRCIHIAEDLENDDIFGMPRLEACWNRVYDLLKIMAGSGEAAWKLLDTGHILTTKEGGKLPTRPELLQDLEDQVEEFVHGLRRWLLAEGLEATGVEGTVEDPTGLVKINVALISAATSIPQRILIGSEQGELASSQDEQNWANQIATRQQNYAGPMILRPLINRLIWAGVLPRPSSGAFCQKWQPLVESKREENAKVGEMVGRTLRTLGIEVDPKEFVKVFVTELPATAVERKPPPPPQLLPLAAGDEPPSSDPANEPSGTEPTNGADGEEDLVANRQGGDDAVAGVRFRGDGSGWAGYP